MKKAKITDSFLDLKTYNGLIDNANKSAKIGDGSYSLGAYVEQDIEELKHPWRVKSLGGKKIAISIGDFVIDHISLDIPNKDLAAITDAYLIPDDYCLSYSVANANFYKKNKHIVLEIPIEKFTTNDSNVPSNILPNFTAQHFDKREIYVVVAGFNFDGNSTFCEYYNRPNFGMVYLTNCLEMAGFNASDEYLSEAAKLQIRYINNTSKCIAKISLSSNGYVANIEQIVFDHIYLNNTVFDGEKCAELITGIDTTNIMPTWSAIYDTDTNRKTIKNQTDEITNYNVTQLHNVQLTTEDSKAIPYFDSNEDYGSRDEVSGEVKWATVDGHYKQTTTTDYQKSLQIIDTGELDHLSVDEEHILQLHGFDSTPEDLKTILVSNHASSSTGTNILGYIALDSDLTLNSAGQDPNNITDNGTQPTSLEFNLNTDSSLDYISLFDFATASGEYALDGESITDKFLIRAVESSKPILRYVGLDQMANVFGLSNSYTLSAGGGLQMDTDDVYDPDIQNSIISVDWNAMPEDIIAHHELKETWSEQDDHGGDHRIDGVSVENSDERYPYFLLGNPNADNRVDLYQRNKNYFGDGNNYMGGNFYVENNIFTDSTDEAEVSNCNAASIYTDGGIYANVNLVAGEIQVKDNADLLIDKDNVILKGADAIGDFEVTNYNTFVFEPGDPDNIAFRVGNADTNIFNRILLYGRDFKVLGDGSSSGEAYIKQYDTFDIEDVNYANVATNNLLSLNGGDELLLKGAKLTTENNAESGEGITEITPLVKFINGIAVESYGNSNASSQTFTLTGNPNATFTLQSGTDGPTISLINQDGNTLLMDSNGNYTISVNDSDIYIGDGNGTIELSPEEYVFIDGDLEVTGEITSDDGIALDDDVPITLGSGSDYSIVFDGDDAVHTISGGDFVFTGGNVGIGVSDPDEKLEVNGNIKLTNYNDQIIFSNPTGTETSLYAEDGDAFIIKHAQNADTIIDADGANRLILESNDTNDVGFFGIKDRTDFTFGLFNDHSDSTVRLTNYNDEPIIFSTNRGGAEFVTMTIDGGKVGIGTDSFDSSDILSVYKQRDGVSKIKLKNDSSGTSNVVGVSYELTTGTSTMAMSVWGPNNAGTYLGYSRANVAYLGTYSSTPVSRLVIGNGGDAPIHFYTNTVTRMTIDEDGNVGIGTDSPDAELEVVGNLHLSGGGDLLFDNNNGIYFEDSLSSIASIMILNGSDDLVIGNDVVNNIRFVTDTNDALVIDEDGKVGIGTDSPVRILDVSGGSSVSSIGLHNDASGYNTNDGSLLSHDNANLFSFWNYDGEVRFGSNGTEAIRIDSNQKVGIGTDAPVRILDVSGGSSVSSIGLHNDASGYNTDDGSLLSHDNDNLFSFWNYDGEVRFGSNGTEAIRIDSDQNVGIGTDSPSAALDVAGDMIVSSNVAAGSFGVSDVGVITLTGDARVYKNEWVNVSGLKAPGTKPATYIDWGINGAWEFSNGTDDTLVTTIRLPLDMDKTVAPEFKIGFASDTNTGDVVWQLEYLYVSPNEDTTAAAQETLTTTQTISATADGLTIGTITGMDLPSATDQLLTLRIKRLGADASDTLTDDVAFIGCGLKYVVDKLGVAL